MRLFLLAFITCCIFDPTDMTGGKVALFAALWGTTGLRMLRAREAPQLPHGLVVYVLAFVTIPVISILCYYIFDAREPFDGPLMLKGYLLISVALVLALNKIDIIPMLCAVLAILAVVVIATFVALMLQPEFYDAVKAYGHRIGLVEMDRRDFGFMKVLQVYFVTSPMLVVPIAYYFDLAMTSKRRLIYLALTAVCIAGMALAGTRNNVFIAVLLPMLIWPQYTKRPILYTVLSFAALGLMLVPFADEIQALLDPAEGANNMRVELVGDYLRMFSDPLTLLFGRGLGAYEYWSARPEFMAASELTYFEMVRNFGIVGAAVMLVLLLAPAARPFLSASSAKERSLAIAWLLYMVMSITNPMIFSSMGILILAALLAMPRSRREPSPVLVMA